MKHAGRVIIGLLSACGLFLTGCGSDDNDGGGAPAPQVADISGYWEGMFVVVDGPTGHTSLTLTQTGNTIGGYVESGLGRIVEGRIDAGNGVYLRAVWSTGFQVEFALVVVGETMSGTSKMTWPNGRQWVTNTRYWRAKGGVEPDTKTPSTESQTLDNLASEGVDQD